MRPRDFHFEETGRQDTPHKRMKSLQTPASRPLRAVGQDRKLIMLTLYEVAINEIACIDYAHDLRFPFATKLAFIMFSFIMIVYVVDVARLPEFFIHRH